MRRNAASRNVRFGPIANITVAAALSENSSCRGHRYLDGGQIASGRAWLGLDQLDPNNEDGCDHDRDNGQRLAHGDVPSVTDM